MQGYPEAMCYLVCNEGEGVACDVKEALLWFRKGAEAGHCGSMCWLAEALTAGDARPVDLDEARRWYGAAAEAGSEEAARRLLELGSK
jgi:TPR repeat protein